MLRLISTHDTWYMEYTVHDAIQCKWWNIWCAELWEHIPIHLHRHAYEVCACIGADVWSVTNAQNPRVASQGTQTYTHACGGLQYYTVLYDQTHALSLTLKSPKQSARTPLHRVFSNWPSQPSRLRPSGGTRPCEQERSWLNQTLRIPPHNLQIVRTSRKVVVPHRRIKLQRIADMPLPRSLNPEYVD